ncbi:MAG: nucleotidyltransferase family protein [Anaerolineales bacterium]|nr:nucleotidyltransferase family protein [Anaerolineales bacterium]
MNLATISPEMRLILAGALFPLQPDERDHLRHLCQSSVDWPAFLTLTIYHHLAPLLYANLKRHAADLVPPETLAALQTRTAQNRQRVLALMVEANTLRALLAPAGIPFCLLKGPPLSQQLYGDVALRTTADLDVLIHETQLDETDVRLKQAGFQRTTPAVDLTPRQWRVFKRLIHHFVYVHTMRGTHLELHWTLATPDLLPPAAMEQIWQRAQAAPTPGRLADPDQVCYLILHGARHGWEQLKWLADIAMFLRQTPSPDWETVRAQMDALDLLRPLGQALLLARALFQAPIPPALSPLLEDRAIQRFAAQAMEIIFEGFGAGAGQGRRWRALHYGTGMKASWRFKLAVLSQLWMTEDDWEEIALPDALFPLYFVLRPLLWFRRYRMR